MFNIMNIAKLTHIALAKDTALMLACRNKNVIVSFHSTHRYRIHLRALAITRGGGYSFDIMKYLLVRDVKVPPFFYFLQIASKLGGEDPLHDDSV